MNWFSRKPFAALLVSMVLVASLPLLLSNLFYARFQSTVLEQQKELTGESLKFSVELIDKALNDMTALSIKLDKELKGTKIPAEEEMEPQNRLELNEITEKLAAEIGNNSAYIDDIYLFSADSVRAVGNKGVYSGDMIYRKFFKVRGVSREKMEQLHETVSYGSLVPLGDSLMAFVRTLSRNSEPKKQLVIILEPQFCTSLIDNANVEGGVFILSDNGGSVLAVSNKTGNDLNEEDLGQLLEGADAQECSVHGEKALLYSQGITTGGYVVTAAIPYSQVLDSSREMRFYHFLLMAVSILLSLLLAVFLSRRSVMPLNSFISYIRENYGASPEGTWGLERIRSAVDDLLAQRRSDREQLWQYETVIARNSLRETLRGNARANEAFQLPEGSRYAVACFSAGSAPLEAANEQIARSARHVLPGDCFFRSVIQDGRIVEVLAVKDQEFEESRLKELLTAQVAWLDQQEEFTFSAAYSTIHSDSGELERAYGEASIAMMLSYAGDDVLTSFSGCEAQTSLFLRDWHHLDKQLLLSSMVGEGRFAEAAELLSELFPAEFLEEYFPESEISKLHLASLKYQFLHDMDIVADLIEADESTRSRSMQELIYCKNHRDLYRRMEQIYSELAAEQKASETVDADKADPEEGQVGEIRHYIRHHYQDPQLSVSSIAEAFGMSANGLSQMFSRKADGGVLDYIHEVRMKKAGELLREEKELTIQDVSVKVGYTSILTFNRKFKATYGQTPSEFRKAASGRKPH